MQRFAPLADAMIAVEPERALCDGWDRAGAGADRLEAPKFGQVPVCWDEDRDAAIARAHEQFRWFAGGWKVNAELPGPAGFAAATQFVTKDDVAENIPCGNDPDAIVSAVKPFWEAGFTHVALVQIGGDHQGEFFAAAREHVLPALREAAG